MNINIVQGDILKADTDTIVNPANGHLRHGGGLARVIAQAAAPFRTAEWAKRAEEGSQPRRDVEWQDEQDQHPLIATGNAGWTSAGALPFKGIVHAVGPIWDGGAFFERSLLKSAHYRALRVAADHGCESVAFPAISCGIFGFPVEEAAPIAVTAVQEWLDIQERSPLGPTRIKRVEFYLFEDAHFEAFNNALSAVTV